MGPAFKDHFSTRSGDYARYRPGYPPELFAWLASLVSKHDRAWDCACGTGEASGGLARHFARVEATDASAAQIAEARGPANVRFRVAPAEASGLGTGSVDLVLVAQALHWFDHDRFHAEARRVTAPEGVVAAVAYDLSSVTPEIDALMRYLYRDITGPFWPPERRYFDEGYARSIPFPFPRIEPPALVTRARWRADDMLGFLRTWSAVKRYEAARGTDPLALIEDDLRKAWGEDTRTVTWPLEVLAGRMNV